MDEVAHLQLKRLPQRFVLNPLDFGNVKAFHGFMEMCFNLLILL